MKTFTIACCLMAATGAASGATITGFSATIVPANSFGLSVINSAFDASTGRITNSSITCGSQACSGPIATFSITGTGLFAPTPFSADIDGTFTSIASGLGGITINGLNGGNAIPFTFSAGPFSKNIGTATLAPTMSGNFAFTGSLALSIAPFSTLSLPNSLTFTVGAAQGVPEPGTAALFGGSLIGLFYAVRRRRT